MDREFWLDRWAENRIGFHENQPHPKLIRYIDHLQMPQGGRIFLPLCGKSVDFDWLLQKGYQAVGAEFSETAIREVFDRNNIAPKVEAFGKAAKFSGGGLTLFAGDIFDLTAELLGRVDGVFDRAALVALPEATRIKYCKHLGKVTNTAPQLIVTFEYDQSKMSGPPFSVERQEIKQNYSERYNLTILDSKPLTGNLATQVTGKQVTWLAKPK